MKNQGQLKKAIAILNSTFIAVLIAYSLDFLAAVFIETFQSIVLLILIPAKIYLYAGLYGSFIEIVSSEEVYLTWSNFQKNARRYWPICSVLIILPVVMHWSLSVALPSVIIPPYQNIAQHFNVVLLSVIALWIFNKKYFAPFDLPKKRVVVFPKAIFNLGILYILDLVIFYLPQFFTFGDFDITWITALLSKYLSFLEFLYIAQLIVDSYSVLQDKFDHKREIFLINPIGSGIFIGPSFKLFNIYPPFFTVLKALSPSEYKFREFNQMVWHPRYYRRNKLVAITCFTSNSAEAYKIAKEFRKAGSTVIMGGPHVTYLSDEALDFCDSVVTGEVEGIWPNIIKDFENNDLKKRYIGQAVENYHEVTHQYLLKSPPHIIRDFIETTRGCKFHCDFCTIPSLSGGRVRKKPIEDVVALVKRIKPNNFIFNFLDNNIYNDPAYARELFKAMKPLKVNWGSFCTIDIAKNEEILKLAREGGCRILVFGYEISGKSTEKDQGGKFAMAKKYIEFTRKIKKAGIQIRGNFIFGFDSDKWQSLLSLWKFCFQLNPFWTVLCLLTPLPGTKLYGEMLMDDRIFNLNWYNYSFHKLVFKHQHFNSNLMSKIFSPSISLFFMLTTCKLGYLIIFSLTGLWCVYKYVNPNLF